MRKRILVLNQGDTPNYGDQAIHRTIECYFTNQDYEVISFPFWKETDVFGKHYYHYPKIVRWLLWHVQFLLDFFNRQVIRKKINENFYDAIIIGGGELLSSHYGFNSSMYFWTKFASKKNIPIILLGVSGNIDMPKRKLKRYRKALALCSKIYVRDHYTGKICRENYDVNSIVRPDVVFGFQKICSISNSVAKKRDTLLVVPIAFYDGIKKGLHVSNEEEYLQYLVGQIESHLLNHSKIVITCTENGDELFARKLTQALQSKNYDVIVDYHPFSNLENYLNLLSNTKTIISGRMHAMILGKLFSCDVVSIKFKKKLEVFEQEYGIKKDLSGVAEEVFQTFCEIHSFLSEGGNYEKRN